MESKESHWRSKKGAVSKIKANVSLDPHIYLIGKNIGNLSAMLNEAAKYFISSDIRFKKFIASIQDEAIPVNPRAEPSGPASKIP
jgi:hypothetical protein